MESHSLFCVFRIRNGNGGGEYDYQRQQLHRRGKQDTKFACSVPGCGSTFTRRSGEQKQLMIQKRRQTEVQILGLGGPYQIALLPSLIMPPFSDLSSSHLLRLMLACYSSSHRTLCFQSHFFIRCVASHPICISTASARIKRLVLLCLGCCEYVFFK